MIEKDARKLLEKYRSGTLNAEEKALLESWYIDYYKQSRQPVFTDEELQKDLDEVYKLLPLNEQTEPKPVVRPIARILLYAASIAIFFMAGTWFIKYKKNDDNKQVASHQADIKPANGSIILTLANNKKVTIDNRPNGNVARQGSITVNKTSTGLLTYQISDKNLPGDAPVEFNTIATSQGRQLEVALSDGTKVWLNAMSSIHFPTAFRGGLRQVEITGEAYFEVAKNAKMPFRVISGGQTVQVLGTHFNINAYQDERAIETTLLEGSVKVSLQSGRFEVLKPRQRSTVVKESNILSVKDCDAEETIAWKNGYFQFNDNNLKSIMNTLSRWYDIEVVYQNINPDLIFGGTISRSKNLSQVLKILELTGNVHFKTEGRRITIMP